MEHTCTQHFFDLPPQVKTLIWQKARFLTAKHNLEGLLQRRPPIFTADDWEDCFEDSVVMQIPSSDWPTSDDSTSDDSTSDDGPTSDVYQQTIAVMAISVCTSLDGWTRTDKGHWFHVGTPSTSTYVEVYTDRKLDELHESIDWEESPEFSRAEKVNKGQYWHSVHWSGGIWEYLQDLDMSPLTPNAVDPVDRSIYKSPVKMDRYFPRQYYELENIYDV